MFLVHLFAVGFFTPNLQRCNTTYEYELAKKNPSFDGK
jgi:hypothetical protein